ncbi:NUDIX hydrolase [Microlunatus soli]|uniref:ADP-ribose pyrophosphatase YjhB, NUDIX family n=1 Tax=Microlunatus soli TaxID=630515 RepID=A0A1H1T0C6_9ACTN|nr:CoA pyrophosphatase [Microlunatus soli]SDS53682.1 ADP-ribose pyrophosphatase YjhB, NUDIX family [Microlunatus soli]
MSPDDGVPAWLDTLRNSLDDPGTPHTFTEEERRPAAVLILLGEDTLPGPDGGAPVGGPDLLFIERAAGLRSHPGQVAFPGGGYEPGDHDLADTALRESVEETGLDRDGVQVLGELATIEVPISGYQVTPVLGWWRRPSPIGVVDPGEVAAVLRIPIARLADPENRFTMTHPSGRYGPGFFIGELLIWGLTAYMVDGVLTRGGWQQPWDRRRTKNIPDRYLGRV